MEVNFDKQIDTILRDLAKRNRLGESPPAAHLDVDELSAFAENALPPKSRLRAMEHLADCPHCRKILSTFVSLEPANESETIHEEAKTIAAIPAIPWYRQLFAFPQLSYLMGALALVLTGAIGLLLWQNAQDSSRNVAMSETTAEKVKGPSGASSEGEAPAFESYSANSANSAANTTSPIVSNANSSVATNSTANTSSAKAENSSTESAPKPLATPAVVSDADTSPSSNAKDVDKSDESERDRKVLKEGAVSAKGGERNQPITEATPTPSAGQSRADDNLSLTQNQRAEVQNNRAQNMTPDGETKRTAPPAPASVAKKSAPREEAESADEARKNKAEPRAKSTPAPAVFKDVAGKSFRNANGVWTDTTYKGGSTINIRRGSGEYKKLDSGLRSTADYLGGTVIIAWKGKNYKIQ